MTYEKMTVAPTVARPLRRARMVRTAKRRLRGPVPRHFEDFYRAHLRYVSGVRLRTLEVFDLYDAWAADNGRPSMNLNALKRAMANVGHVAFNSGGMRYGDVALASDYPDLADNYPAIAGPAVQHASTIADRLDTMITELAALRADVLHAGEFADLTHGR